MADTSGESPTDAAVLRRVDDGVAWITLNRPEAGNALTAAMRVVMRVHCSTSYAWPYTEPSVPACFSKAYDSMINVADLSNAGPAI